MPVISNSSLTSTAPGQDNQTLHTCEEQATVPKVKDFLSKTSKV